MSEEFKLKVYKEFQQIHRQLADHSLIFSELKAGQQKLEAGQQKLEAGQQKLEAEIKEVRADVLLMDSKLNFICNYLRRQMEDDTP